MVVATFTLEIIAGGVEVETELPLEIYLQKRVEHFTYLKVVPDYAVALDWVKPPKVSSDRNLAVLDRSVTLPGNTFADQSEFYGYQARTGLSIISRYSELLITNEYIRDEIGRLKPLFYTHDLPQGSSKIRLEKFVNGHSIEISSGYKWVESRRRLYTNYLNEYDTERGDYVLYYVNYIDEDGNGHREMLNPQPAAREATWEDIDPDTGELIGGDLLIYSKTLTSSAYSYTMNQVGTYFYRPYSQSLIRPLGTRQSTPEEPWIMKFSAGRLHAVTNGAARIYSLPEYNTQPFYPSIPYLNAINENVEIVNDHVIFFRRDYVYIRPDLGFHCQLVITDFEGNVVQVLSTNSSLEGERWADTDVFIDTQSIASWDNYGGFVTIGTKILPSYSVRATYVYRSRELDYTALNLNPFLNRSIEDKMIVFYVIPNVGAAVRAMHHLIVDRDGYIVECSQQETTSYPGLQLKNLSGDYNPDTVIGTSYLDFLEEYAVGYPNDNAYAILAEINNIFTETVDELTIVDVREQGDSIKEERVYETLKRAAKLAQTRYFYGPDGQEIPKAHVLVAEPPLTLLEGYGGSLTKERAESLMREQIASDVHVVFDWTFPSTEYTLESDNEEVTITWKWINSQAEYRVYYKTNAVGEWLLLHTEPPTSIRDDMTYVHTGLNAGDVMYYCVRAVVDGVEFPELYSTAIEVDS